MDVSIVIPIYHRTEWIGKCIRGLLEQDFEGPFEIIVVDDGSPNAPKIRNLVEGFPGRENPVIRYIRKGHAGPAAARNYGVRLSSGRILCFLDDDSIPDRRWLREIIYPFQGSETTGLVSGKTCSYDQEATLPVLLEMTIYAGKSWATCNIAYRRDIFKVLGGFDESFHEASWEDNDLGMRARWAGYGHVYNEGAIVYHSHERSIVEFKRKCLRNGRGAALFSRKYLFKRPLWAISTPFAMSRRLVYGIYPSVWRRRTASKPYLKFLWSFYSLQGFIGTITGKDYGKD